MIFEGGNVQNTFVFLGVFWHFTVPQNAITQGLLISNCSVEYFLGHFQDVWFKNQPSAHMTIYIKTNQRNNAQNSSAKDVYRLALIEIYIKLLWLSREIVKYFWNDTILHDTSDSILWSRIKSSQHWFLNTHVLPILLLFS